MHMNYTIRKIREDESCGTEKIVVMRELPLQFKKPIML